MDKFLRDWYEAIICLIVIGLIWYFSPNIYSWYAYQTNVKNYKYKITTQEYAYYTNNYKIENNCIIFQETVLCNDYQIHILR